MVLPRYLAMTRAEFTRCSSFPQHIAWMACHFSPYGTGLVNLPLHLPEGAMVILNDRIPMAGHDPHTVLDQLQRLNMTCLLLDFQQIPTAESFDLARLLTESMHCPVGMPPDYGQALPCSLFLSPVPPDLPLEEYLTPWEGRELWLEIATDAIHYTVTESGSAAASLSHMPEVGAVDEDLCCHYRVQVTPDQAEFDIWRTREDMDILLKKAKSHGVTKAVGLWQELGK